MASLAAVAYFGGPGATVAMAGSGPGPSGAAATPGSNICATAPHDTFNISAINVDMTLNKFGVHDPNSFMYVLNSNDLRGARGGGVRAGVDRAEGTTRSSRW